MMNRETGCFTLPQGRRIEKLGYILYSPKNLEPGRQYPLILFLHGHGERGSGEGIDLELVNVNGLPKTIVEGKEYDAFILCPQCPNEGNIIWSELTYELHDLTEDFVCWYPIDAKRQSVTGLSMGGYGTWALGMAFTDTYCALAPICGGGISWDTFVLKDMPIWAFHGDADSIVPVNNSIEMCDVLTKRYGGHPKLTIFHGVDHDSWTPAYNDTKLTEWLLEQHKDR